MAKSKTIVKNILIVLSCIDEALAFPKGLYEWYNWEQISIKRAQAWNQLIEKFEEPVANAKVKYLKKSGYVKKIKPQVFGLTEKGWQKIAVEVSEKYVAKKTKKPKHYMIVFDVPEEQRRVRDLLRKCLVNLGFDSLQLSIFITNSEKAFQFAEWLVGQCGLKSYVKFIKAEKIW